MSPAAKRTPPPAKAAVLASIAGELSMPAVSLRRQPQVQLPRQFAGAAAQIDHPHARPLLDEIEQVEEGLRPLDAKARVLLRVPVSRRR